MNFTSQATGTLVDAYGVAKARKADADADMKAIQAVIQDRHGASTNEGELFRFSLAESAASSVDRDAMIVILAREAGYTDKRLQNLYDRNTSRSTKWVPKCGSRITAK
jgi:hypothetical protein